ncbi:hypothetical protein KPL71_017263 [Citrus sinensis]|uniref:Uncharacterized protein n=1 Tax=Citrus sinensis TaxID=2711 RepID=A0ACB8JMS2_CITSI|nr:hypothetical protein KPL71_017263 [Citrus sinensis]
MIEGASLNEHIDEFNKVCDELETIDEGLSDERKALLLISSLPKSYEHFVDTLLYEMQTLSLKEVKSALGTKKLKDKQDNPENYFTTYQLCDEGMILMGNNSMCKVVGIGTVSLRMFDGVVRELTQVRFVLDLKRNLISIGMLDRTGCVIKAENGVLRMIKGSIVIMKGIKENGMYVLNRHTAVGEASVTDSGRNKAMLWHLRQIFQAKFETEAHTTKEKLGYIHFDLWGPAQVTSLEALNTACYLVNKSPSTAIGCKTQIELWLGRIADYSKLRIFGCIAYAHVKQGKLEPRALKCMFLGYPEGVKGHRLWSHVNSSELGVKSDKVKFQVEPHNLKELELEIESVGKELEAVADLIAYALTAAYELNDDEPRTYQEVITSKKKLEWTKAMDEEMASLMKNKTWELIIKPEKRKIVNYKWIFKIKEEIPGAEPRRFKARLVARGFTQKEGIDFTEVFFPVVRHASIRIILALVAVQDMHLEQMDVKTAFLHGELQEAIIMQQPKGYMVSRKGDQVCLLRRSLYGLKQSPRQWYLREEIDHLKKLLSREFEMKELGEAKRILGMDIIRDRSKKVVFLTQQSYINRVLVSLMYTIVLTRPDISHPVSIVSKFMANPSYEYWRVVQWIMRYLKGTLEVGLVYGGKDSNGHTLIGYVDANFVGDLDKRRSQTGGAVKLLKIHTEENPADMLSKVVPTAKFILCMNLAGICRFEKAAGEEKTNKEEKAMSVEFKVEIDEIKDKTITST